MYKRLDEETARKNRGYHEKDDAYRIVYDTLDWVSYDTHDLSPEEIWTEANSIIEELRATPLDEGRGDKVNNCHSGKSR